jgi:hypothetical protein
LSLTLADKTILTGEVFVGQDFGQNSLATGTHLYDLFQTDVSQPAMPEKGISVFQGRIEGFHQSG